MDLVAIQPQPESTQTQPTHTHLSTSSYKHLSTTHPMDTSSNINDKMASGLSSLSESPLTDITSACIAYTF